MADDELRREIRKSITPTPQRPGPCERCDSDPNDTLRPHCAGVMLEPLPNGLAVMNLCKELRAMFDAGAASERAKLKRAFNINDCVWLRLTDDGREVHRSYYADLMKSAGLDLPTPPLHEVHGCVRFQLWQAMHVFGPHMYLGGPNLFDMDILLEEPSE